MANKTEQELNNLISELKSEIITLKKDLKTKVKYGLTFERKTEKVVEECENKIPVLKEVIGKKIETDKVKPMNILIEGDNYHSLQVLNYTHQGKIDVIYIDPPYNTGNKDFIYNDIFVDKEDSFSHSKWLSFMERRLFLARDLLSDDGVIFISIGEDEVAQLKLLCNLIFGEFNFISQIVWHNNVKGRQMDLHIKNTYESILVYARDIKKININQEKDNINTTGLERDDISYYKKDYPLHNGTADFHINNRPNLAYSIYYNKLNGKAVVVDEKTKSKNGFTIKGPTRKDLIKKGYVRIIPKYNSKYNNQRVWRWGQEKFLREYKTELLFLEEDDGMYIYQKKRYGEDGEYQKKFKNYINIDGGVGKNELLNILGLKKFDNPKPSLLIKYLIEIFGKERSVILDFFAGSGTTGHAVLEHNKDGEYMQFILCTNNGDERFEHNIASDVCYPRIQKVIEGYTNKKGEKIKGLGGNLRYFRTTFIDKKRNKDEMKFKITNVSTEILCLKEGIFDVIEEIGDEYSPTYKIVKGYTKDGPKVMGIYFDINDKKLDEMRKKLLKYEEDKVAYIFSLSDESLDINHNDWFQIKIEPIPEKILKVYEYVYKLNKK